MRKLLGRFARSPAGLRWFLNLYGPYLGAGVRVDYLAEDFRELKVSMGLHWYNRNYVGTHFGGSLYSMIDPFYMLMVMNVLGPDYVVWDKSASIDFIRPGKGRVCAHFHLSDETIDRIRKHTASGDKYLPQWDIDIVDEQGQCVARVSKTLYIRRKPSQS
ncbi:MAG: DUF4442 domain-containing protein [Pseudomonadota bacterium]|uniref:DUF4442 domain-containing protein n=1 Tax=Alcanivorax sp. TaxID=1872427 RepID=UPI002440E2C0|nr:DUF4442 domain-containing protein [Alcanivorax sp.]MED5238278.1 DUF4442 domain-containing protein [Pseudomonadota bacterium]MEE3320124.1 DUF4442 domain-containing protein [Pseudomonadota bacterium]